jgi:hypothetical protein
MPKGRKPPSQTWRTFLDNHIRELVSIDFMATPTATFRMLYVIVGLAHNRRRVVHFNVTEHPTAARMRRVFEAASKLPRSQQEKIAAVIEAFVNQHSDREV